MKKAILLFLITVCLYLHSFAKPIVVDQRGKGDFKSIQAAINSLSTESKEPRVILIHRGIYKEKIYLEKSHVVLQGEDPSNTIITASIARDEWRCNHNDDWGVATMNIEGNDIVLKNLTITNNYGFDHQGLPENSFQCDKDTAQPIKKIRADGHQMAFRTFNATRLSVINCILRAFGGDTVSPWNVDEGMFYFKDCVMEGGVDFYCPRGWAYAEGCTFIAHTGPASIWHDGSTNKDSKTVLKNCTFKGYDGFKLGRYHKDSQFYLINCTFADNMADTPIYKALSGPSLKWGERIYYYNCHRKAGDYTWFANNLPEGVIADQINFNWTFGFKWELFAFVRSPYEAIL